jgi:hypothetical protein
MKQTFLSNIDFCGTINCATFSVVPFIKNEIFKHVLLRYLKKSFIELLQAEETVDATNRRLKKMKTAPQPKIIKHFRVLLAKTSVSHKKTPLSDF